VLHVGCGRPSQALEAFAPGAAFGLKAAGQRARSVEGIAIDLAHGVFSFARPSEPLSLLVVIGRRL
jgi:hypothetical protein